MDKTCTLEVGSTYGRVDEQSFPLNRQGWARAHQAAMSLAKNKRRLGMVDLKCAGGRVALYQCNNDRNDVYCVIEEVGGPGGPENAVSIAGHRRRRRRR